MKCKFLILILIASIQTYAQLNTQGVLSNEQALLIAKQDGFQTLNIPILSRYKGLTENQANILEKLKLYSIIEYSVIDPVNQIVDTKITYTGNDYIAGRTQQGNIIKTYLAVALVKVDKVIEVRQHQTKNNAQTVDFQFKILNNSKVGNALQWFKVGNTITHTVDYINTSNGWKKDIEDRNDISITSYKSSKYGLTGLNNYRSTLKDVEFIRNIDKNIIGRWDRITSKEKRREYYIFNQDGTFENFIAKKNETIKGKYKFSTNLGDKIYVSLIPREGKNKSISVQRNNSGIYINTKSFKKEGGSTISDNNISSSTDLDERKNKLLEAKKKLYPKRLTGYWKSPNGKTTLDISENKTLVLNTKNEKYENASYELFVEDGNLFFKVFDKDLMEVFNEELKVVRSDQMILGGKKYIKF